MTDFAEHLEDCDGNMNLSDRESLHRIIKAFFLQSKSDKVNELLMETHDKIENLERDLSNMGIDGATFIDEEFY